MEENKIIIYTSIDGNTKIDVKLEDDTLWLTQTQMCELYQTSRTNVVEHMKHIYEEGELQEEATCRKFRQVRQEGERSKGVGIARVFQEGAKQDSLRHPWAYSGGTHCGTSRCREGLYGFTDIQGKSSYFG